MRPIASPLREVNRVGDALTASASALAARAAELSESEALKGAILESALDCVVALRDESRIVEWNPAAERTFGYAREDGARPAAGRPDRSARSRKRPRRARRYLMRRSGVGQAHRVGRRCAPTARGSRSNSRSRPRRSRPRRISRLTCAISPSVNGLKPSCWSPTRRSSASPTSSATTCARRWSTSWASRASWRRCATIYRAPARSCAPPPPTGKGGADETLAAGIRARRSASSRPRSPRWTGSSTPS